jgi:hypothetical protein
LLARVAEVTGGPPPRPAAGEGGEGHLL